MILQYYCRWVKKYWKFCGLYRIFFCLYSVLKISEMEQAVINWTAYIQMNRFTQNKIYQMDQNMVFMDGKLAECMNFDFNELYFLLTFTLSLGTRLGGFCCLLFEFIIKNTWYPPVAVILVGVHYFRQLTTTYTCVKSKYGIIHVENIISYQTCCVSEYQIQTEISYVEYVVDLNMMWFIGHW